MSTTLDRSKIRSSLGALGLAALAVAFVAILCLYSSTVANAQTSGNQPNVTAGTPVATPVTTPTSTVVSLSSPALDIPGKVQLSLINPAKAKAKVKCKGHEVKSFAKRGRKTRICLPVGAKYTLQTQDRNRTVHVVTTKVKKGDRRFYKGSDGKWRKVSTNSLALALGKAEFRPTQYVLYTTFPAVPFAVQVAYKVTSDIAGVQGKDECNKFSTTPGHGEATDILPVTVTAVYTDEAKNLAVQQLPQSFKDVVSQKATADAKSKQQTVTTLMACISGTIDDPAPMTLIAVEITNGPLDVTVNGTVWIYAKMKDTGTDVSFDFDQPAYGYLGPKHESGTYDGQPCPSGYSCFVAQYKAPSYVTDDFVSVTAFEQNGVNFGGDIVYINVVDDDFGS